MEAVDTRQFIVADLNEEQFGIEITYIDNIIVLQNITRVPKAQSYYKGVINLRGEIIPVMNLSLRLGMAESELTEKSRIIIVRPEQQSAPVGLIVDEVKEAITLEQTDIEKITYKSKDDKKNFSIGIGKCGADLINLLNITAIVLDKEVKA